MDTRPFFGKICKSGVILRQNGHRQILWQFALRSVKYAVQKGVSYRLSIKA
jgi:hypothetical protein